MRTTAAILGALAIILPAQALARELRGAIIVACKLRHVVALKGSAATSDRDLPAAERKQIAFRMPIVGASDMTAADFDILDPQRLLDGKMVKDWKLPSASDPKLSWVAATGDDKDNVAAFGLSNIVAGANGLRTGEGSVTLVSKVGAEVSTTTYLGNCNMTGTATDGSDVMAALKKKYGEGAGGSSK